MSQTSADFSPFIVFGSSKSGTTWLQRLIDSHPEIRCHFQIPIFPLKDRSLWVSWQRYRIGKASPFNGVFSDYVAEKQYRKIHDLFYDMDILQPKFHKTMTRGNPDKANLEINRIYLRILRGLVESTLKDNPEALIFGSKTYTNLDLFFDVFPNGKVIHIIRDGRDVCVSKRFHFLRMGIYFPGEERALSLKLLKSLPLGQRVVLSLQNRFQLFDKTSFMNPGTDHKLFTHESLKKITLEWERITRYILRYQKRYPDQFCTVRFEELKKKPVATLKRVCFFLNADSADSLMERVIEENTFQQLKKKKDGFFRKGIAGDWRNHFKEGDVELFKAVAGDLLVELGYEKTENWCLNH